MAKSFLDFIGEKQTQLDEAFNTEPYELTMGKKNAGDVFFTFVDEDEKEFRIQFYTPQGLGKNVRQVFIGQKRGSTYPDAISKFRNPLRVIASMIEATKQFLATPLGKTIDGFAVNFSKKALDRGVVLIPKIIRQSGLKQKLNVMDLTYSPVPDRAFVWVIRKNTDPAQVFDGPKMKGVTWDDPDKVGDVPVQNNAPATGAAPVAHLWNYTLTGDERFPTLTFGTDRSYTVFGSPKTKQIVGTHFGQKYRGTSLEDVLYKIGAPTPTDEMIKQFKTDMANPADVGTNDTNGWKLTSDNGQPMLIWVGSKRGQTVTANIAPHFNEPGEYVGAYMNEKSVRGQSADFITRQLKLPQIPASILNDFSKQSSEFWKKSQKPADITEGITIPSNGRVTVKTSNSFTIRWEMSFPSKSAYAGAVLETKVVKTDGQYGISSFVSLSNKILNSPRSYDYKGDLNRIFKESGERYSQANRQLQTLGSENYNPQMLGMDLLSVSPYGEILFDGKDLGLPSNGQVVISAIHRLEVVASKVKAKKDPKQVLKDFADSAIDSAPRGRDLDWEIYNSSNGGVEIYWSITFRRSTSFGAYQQYSSQVSMANRYLQTIASQAKDAGLKVIKLDPLTRDEAISSDERSLENNGSAYSEYEQSIGGSVTIGN